MTDLFASLLDHSKDVFVGNSGNDENLLGLKVNGEIRRYTCQFRSSSVGRDNNVS
jgi:hypothetical protein